MNNGHNIWVENHWMLRPPTNCRKGCWLGVKMKSIKIKKQFLRSLIKEELEAKKREENLSEQQINKIIVEKIKKMDLDQKKDLLIFIGSENE